MPSKTTLDPPVTLKVGHCDEDGDFGFKGCNQDQAFILTGLRRERMYKCWKGSCRLLNGLIRGVGQFCESRLRLEALSSIGLSAEGVGNLHSKNSQLQERKNARRPNSWMLGLRILELSIPSMSTY